MDGTDLPSQTYQSYLIRFWREDRHKPWRAVVLRSGIEHAFHFAEFEELIAFLQQRLADNAVPDAAGASPDLEG